MENNLAEMEKSIISFIEITSSSREVAILFLQTHQWNLNAAVSNFLDDPNVPNPRETRCDRSRSPNLRIKIPDTHSSSSDDDDSSDYSPLQMVRKRDPSDPSRYLVHFKPMLPGEDPSGCRTFKRRRYGGKTRTFGDVSGGTNSDSDEVKEYYGGGKKRMLEQDHEKAKDVDAIMVKANESAIERPEESSRSMSRDTVSAELQEQQQDQPHDVFMSTVTIWRNGYTVGDSSLRKLDNPANAAFLESITKMESPRLLDPVCVHVKLIRREENFTQEQQTPFQAESDSVSTEPPLTTTQPPSVSLLVVDPAAPTTSIQLRLADGTRLVTRFNTHHTVRDIRGFMDAARPTGSKDYQLLIMGFPLKPLPDFDQTIEKAGIANCVLIQKF